MDDRYAEEKADTHFWGACDAHCGKQHAYWRERYGHSWTRQPLSIKLLGRERAKSVIKRVEERQLQEAFEICSRVLDDAELLEI